MGIIDTVFGEDDKQKFLRSPVFEESERARERLEEISLKPLPTIPTRKIADLPEQGPERLKARETALELSAPTETADFFSLPDVQGIIAEVTNRGDLLANRLGRSLQLSGNKSSTTGRGILGRTVTEIQQSLAASLAPFAEAQRNRAFADVQRRQNLIPLLESLGLVEEERQRTTEQLKLDAEFTQKFGVSQQELSQLIPQLQFLAQLKPGAQLITQLGDAGIIEQISAVAGAGSSLGGIISGLGSFGGGGGGGGGGGTLGGTTFTDHA